MSHARHVAGGAQHRQPITDYHATITLATLPKVHPNPNPDSYPNQHPVSFTGVRRLGGARPAPRAPPPPGERRGPTAHRALPRGARRQPRWRRRRRGRVATRPRGDAQRCGAQRAKPVKHSPLTLVFKLRDIYEVECVNERSELCRTDRVIAGQRG